MHMKIHITAVGSIYEGAMFPLLHTHIKITCTCTFVSNPKKYYSLKIRGVTTPQPPAPFGAPVSNM